MNAQQISMFFSSGFRSIGMALYQAVGPIVSDIKDFVAEILPVALPVLGLVLAASFGLKFIKKVMK